MGEAKTMAANPIHERRTVNYVSEEYVSDLDTHVVYRVFERSVFSPDVLQSPFRHGDKMEYSLHKITMKATDRGLSCFEEPCRVNAESLLLRLRKNTDRLVLVECKGYCKGQPSREHSKATGYVSALVDAIEPIEVFCTYDELRSIRRQTQ